MTLDIVNVIRKYYVIEREDLHITRYEDAAPFDQYLTLKPNERIHSWKTYNRKHSMNIMYLFIIEVTEEIA